MSEEPDALTVRSGDVTLSGEQRGEGIPVVLLHGLTRDAPLRGDGLACARALRVTA